MTIHLSEEDRANLERLEKDRMKPTRRQKAIALLRLAPGIVPHPRNAAGDEPWRATIPSFQDEAHFRQYTEALKARHRDLGPGEDPKL